MYIDYRPPNRIRIINYLTVTLEVSQMIASTVLVLNAVAVSCWALGSVGGTRRRTCGGFVQWPAAADWWTGGENGASWVQKLKLAQYVMKYIDCMCLLCFHHLYILLYNPQFPEITLDPASLLSTIISSANIQRAECQRSYIFGSHESV